MPVRPRHLSRSATTLLALVPWTVQAQEQGMAGIAAISATDGDRAQRCMALAIAYEAGREPAAGQEAVGQVILNRSRHPSYPTTVCGVVFQGSTRRTGCQFTFTCDGAMRRRLSATTLATATATARRVLAGDAPDRVNGATHYHADYVSPYWAPGLVRVVKIGAHIFYRTPGFGAASLAYAPAAEPDPDLLSRGSTLAEPAWPSPSGSASALAGNGVAPPPSAAGFAPWGLKVN